MSFRYPTLFVSHGTPMLAFGDDPFQVALEQLANQMPKPKAIIAISAHSVSSDEIVVSQSTKNKIQHDFTGFPAELYDLTYDCSGSPELAEQIVNRFQGAGFKVRFDQSAPLDHGIWVPLMALYPKADVPVVRVSLPLNFIPAQILKMGHTLASLREEGVMMMGTGGAVHNLRELKWEKKKMEGQAWAKNFEDWIVSCLNQKNVDALIAADEHPDFFRAHPSIEHYLPLLFTIGATLPNDELTILHRGIEYDTLSMLSFSLNHVETLTNLH